MRRSSMMVLATWLLIAHSVVGQTVPASSLPAVDAKETEALEETIRTTELGLQGKLARQEKFDLVVAIRSPAGRKRWCGNRFNEYLRELPGKEPKDDLVFWNEVKRIHNSPVAQKSSAKDIFDSIQQQLIKRHPILATLQRGDSTAIQNNSTIDALDTPEKLVFSIEDNPFFDAWAGFEYVAKIGDANVTVTSANRGASFSLDANQLGNQESAKVEFTATHKEHKDFKDARKFTIRKRVIPPLAEQPIQAPDSLLLLETAINSAAKGEKNYTFKKIASHFNFAGIQRTEKLQGRKGMECAIIELGGAASKDRWFDMKREGEYASKAWNAAEREGLLQGTVPKVMVCPSPGRGREAVELLKAAKSKGKEVRLAPAASRWEKSQANTLESIAFVACVLSDDVTKVTLLGSKNSITIEGIPPVEFGGW